MRVGVIGCGNISNAYFGGCAPFSHLELVACADLDPERAKAKAEEHNIPQACSVEELLANEEIELVINLTIPAAHAEINRRALEHGKHAYCEKPFALTVDEGREVLQLAEERGLRVGCAPDTFLGGGLQTARKALDSGVLGPLVAATAFFGCGGHESWHPSPEFYYQKGGGPMLDMGPYYLTALVHLLGPAKRVRAVTSLPRSRREITSEPKRGKIMEVEVPTHYSGMVEFSEDTWATVIMSFDLVGHHLPLIELHGQEGSLSAPDPNYFEGEVRTIRRGQADWESVPSTHCEKVGRGLGVADMAAAIAKNRPHRASGELAFHVLEILLGFEASSQSGTDYILESTCQRPEALPEGLGPGEV